MSKKTLVLSLYGIAIVYTAAYQFLVNYFIAQVDEGNSAILLR